MGSLRLRSAALVTLVATGAAAAEEGEAEGELRVTRSGDAVYQGVTPGQDRGVPAPPKKRPGRPTITWIGFQPLDGGSARVFVQASHAFTFQQRVQGEELVVSMPELRLGNYNFQRFMDTSFFDAPTKIIKARPLRKRGVELHIKLKGSGARQADARLERGQDGYHYLFLDFGAGG